MLLLLGGTADARQLAVALVGAGIPLIYSVAGLVRRPDVPCQVISGGFAQHGGLPAVIEQRAIGAILDATHPYAAQMSRTAVLAAREQDIPCWRFQRPAWQAGEGDDWRDCEDWPELLRVLVPYQSVFLSAWLLSQEVLEGLALLAARGQRQVLRTAAAPQHALPESMNWVKAIGPFSVQDEAALLEQYGVDALVSKNSGGEATRAKLIAARARRIPVLMLSRPKLEVHAAEFDDPAACLREIVDWHSRAVV